MLHGKILISKGRVGIRCSLTPRRHEVMEEIMALKEAQKKLAKRYQKTQTAFTHNTIGTAVHGVIEYIQRNPILKKMAEALITTVEGPSLEEWQEAGKRIAWPQPPVERNNKARLCYEILADLYSRMGENGSLFTEGIVEVGHKISAKSSFDECANIFVDNFVDPLYEYLDEEIEALIKDEDVKDEKVVGPKFVNKRRVFVVHGRDEATLKIVLDYLKKNGLEPVTFYEAKMLVDTASPNIISVVDKGMEESQAVVILITPDDVVRLREEAEEELKGQARPNVIFEAGIAFGRYRKRTVLVEYDEPSMFSDLHGFYVVRLKKQGASIKGLEKIIEQLKVAGCELN